VQFEICRDPRTTQAIDGTPWRLLRLMGISPYFLKAGTVITNREWCMLTQFRPVILGLAIFKQHKNE